MPSNPKESALTKTALGFQTAVALRDAIQIEKPEDTNELFILSERIRLCNENSNIWTATDLHNANGESYNGSGRFWNCNSKLCPNCVAKKSRLNRRQLQESISNQKLFVGENYHFITFTIPKTKLGLMEIRKIINLSWSYFRKRQFAKNTFVGGCKSEEFTVSSTGFHYHLHLLVRSKYIRFDKLRAEWTECLKLAFEKCQQTTLTIATADGLAVVNVKKVNSIQNAIQEVAKYITKSDSWQKLRNCDLLDIARIRRFPRMFELFGSFRLPSPVSVEEGQDSEDYLDTKNLSDGSSTLQGWRNRAKAMNVSEYLAELHEEILNATEFRKKQLKFKFPCAKFRQLKPNQNISLVWSIENYTRLIHNQNLPTPKSDFDEQPLTFIYQGGELVPKN